MPERVRITDVAPRDGLQNESRIVPTASKAALVERLAACGVDEVEVSSFVSPKWIPQLADAREVFAQVADARPAGVVFSALVPNEKGMRAALDVNAAHDHRAIDKVSVFTAASETFSQRNTNASIAETLERFAPVIALARQHELTVRAYVSCAIACPFEGPIHPARVAQVCQQLADLGADELDVADTIGAACPETIEALFDTLRAELGTAWLPRITLHLHDTFGRAAACVRAALHGGIRSFDGAAGGLGGCPYASTPERRAPGNIDTALLVQTVQAEGFVTGVDRAALAEASRLARDILNGPAGDTGDDKGNQ